jgi:PAS domain S-box-containing protein
MIKLDRKSIYALGVSVIIMLSFFVVKTLVMINWLHYNKMVQWYEYLSVIFFLPPFLYALNKVYKTQYLETLKKKTLEQILDESCLVSRTDKQGLITDVNAKFCEVSGYKRQELLGKDHRILNSGTHPREMWQQMYQTTVQYRSIWHEIVTNINKLGKYYIVDTHIMATFDAAGKHTGFLSVRQDITDLMNSLKEVDRKNAYLEHAAKILRHDMHSGINTYIPRGIKSLERRLSKLLVSLDIPENLGEKHLGQSLQLLKEGLAHAQRVYNGVKEFTNLVKKEAVMETQPHKLQCILETYFKGTAYNSQVYIEDLGMEDVNESLFCTAIDNLVRNGLRYNDSDTKLVKIYRDANDLIIEDNGRGMSQEQFEEYSKPYTRGENNKESGSGLGLNICVAIMREHGFEVTSEKVETGTKLKVKLL